MRFRTSQSLPPHLNPRLQRRLLGWVAVVGLVVIIGSGLWRSPSREPPPAAVPPGAMERLDYQVRDADDSPLRPDAFRAGETRGDSGLDQEPVVLADPESNPLLDRRLLAAVRDNTLGIRRDEAGSFFAVLDHVRRVPHTFLEQSARKDVQYINLMADPDEHRGEIVTLVGEMWRLYAFPADDNEFGLERLYEAWVVTSDSGSHPIRIVATELGPGLSPGDDLRVPVWVTGYFFKREGYRSQGGLHVAPTILVKRINAYRSPQAPPRAEGIVPVMLGVVVAIGLVLTATLLSFAWSDRQALSRKDYLPPMSREAADALREVETQSVSEALRELSERELFGEPAPRPSPRSPVAVRNGDETHPIDLPTPPPPTKSRPATPAATDDL